MTTTTGDTESEKGHRLKWGTVKGISVNQVYLEAVVYYNAKRDDDDDEGVGEMGFWLVCGHIQAREWERHGNAVITLLFQEIKF